MKKKVLCWMIKIIVIIIMIILNDYVIIPSISDLEWKIAVSFIMGGATIMLMTVIDKLSNN